MTNRKKILLTLSMILGLNTSALMAELTQTQLNATLGIVTNFILDDGITHNGTSYGTVTSPYTGRVWLDRNLGASQACTSFDDPLCYGDYYQWGRGADGHQESNSSITATLATDVNNVGHENFINTFSPSAWTSVDNSGILRATNWSKTDGSSVCPVGFRVPTLTELKTETLDNGVMDSDTAFTNFLKLPLAGGRDSYDGYLGGGGSWASVWTDSVDGSESRIIAIDGGDAYVDVVWHSYGFSVRCIKNTTPVDIVPPVITLTGGATVSILLNDTYSDAGATALDNVDGNLTVSSYGSVNTNIAGDYNITYRATDSEGNVASAVRTVSVLIAHNGTTYSTVTSPYTGRIWLDRNLGASQVCTSYNDPLCYGDYYQWGRNADGHQVSTSTTTTTQATDVYNVGHGNFITSTSAPYDWASVDSNGSLRATNWSAGDGSSVCPVGFRVPTQTELQAETTDNGVTNSASAFTNFLKLPSAGSRSSFDGSMLGVGSWGGVWLSSASGSYASGLYFSSGNAYWYSNGNRAYGRSVRCLRD